MIKIINLKDDNNIKFLAFAISQYLIQIGRILNRSRDFLIAYQVKKSGLTGKVKLIN